MSSNLEQHNNESHNVETDSRKNQLNRSVSNMNLKGGGKLNLRRKRTVLSDIGPNSDSSSQIYREEPIEDSKLLGYKTGLRREGTDLIYTAVKKRKILKDDDQDYVDSNSIPKEEGEEINSTDTGKEHVQRWKNLDSSERDDVLLVAEYTNDIFAHLYSREEATVPERNYTVKSNKTYYRPSVRAILVDWLVEVHEKFQCFQETLLLAINIMDRFLAKTTKVGTDKLQLVAVTALFIAAKYEEIHLPKLAEYAYITAGAASKTSIRKAELFILSTLNFDLGWPNPLNFVRRISKADDYDTETRNIAKYLLEYSICSSKFIDVRPSILAAMVMYIARRITNRNNELWSPTLEHYSGNINPLTDKRLQEYCIELIEDIVTPLAPIKYLTVKYGNVEKYGYILSIVKEWCSLQIHKNFENLFSL